MVISDKGGQVHTAMTRASSSLARRSSGGCVHASQSLSCATVRFALTASLTGVRVIVPPCQTATGIRSGHAQRKRV